MNERKLPQLFTLERIFVCFPLPVGAFMIALGEIAIAAARISYIYSHPNTCDKFANRYLLFVSLVNVRYFCDEQPETYETIFFLEVFLSVGMVLAALLLLFGTIFSVRILVGQYLYWYTIMLVLRIVSYLINVLPLNKTYTEQDFTIMLWGPLSFIFSMYIWLCSYSFLESIPLPAPPTAKRKLKQ